MSLRWLVIAATSIAAAISVAAPADAEPQCRIVKVRKIVRNQIVLVDKLVCLPASTDPVGDTDDAQSPPPAGVAVCIGGAIAVGLDPDEYCFGGDEDDALPVVTGGMVAEALRRMTLPASTLTIQPPDGRTLVNFDTNFFTTNDDPLTRSIQLLGRRVELRIWPQSYTWHFGDGEVSTTTTPGAEYPDLEVTHNYLRTGRYRPSVDTTYTAEWRVAGGQWQPVNGTATIAGAPTSLEAIEARPTLVGYGG